MHENCLFAKNNTNIAKLEQRNKEAVVLVPAD